MCTNTYMYTYIYMYIYMCVRTYIYMYVYIYVYIYMYTYLRRMGYPFPEIVRSNILKVPCVHDTHTHRWICYGFVCVSQAL